MTNGQFTQIMIRVDELRNQREDLAGKFNGLIDGDPDCQCYTEEDLDNQLDSIAINLKMYAKKLKVPESFVDSVLDNCVLNRWEAYNAMKGNLIWN